MATKFIPTIRKTDYDSFRRIINRDLPNTYDEWLNLAAKITADNGGRGHVSNSVEVNPDEFAKYLRAVGGDANLHFLERFAYEKGMGHKY